MLDLYGSDKIFGCTYSFLGSRHNILFSFFPCSYSYLGMNKCHAGKDRFWWKKIEEFWDNAVLEVNGHQKMQEGRDFTTLVALLRIHRSHNVSELSLRFVESREKQIGSTFNTSWPLADVRWENGIVLFKIEQTYWWLIRVATVEFHSIEWDYVIVSWCTREHFLLSK